MAESIEIRSFRSVFELERRIYRIDRFRLNPAGVPLRGVLYALALVAAVAAVERVPVLGALARMAPWYLRWLGFPAAAAALLTVARIDGRPFHLGVGALLAHAAGPRWRSGLARCRALPARRLPQSLVVVVDGSEPRLRRLRFRGPGAVQVACRHRRLDWRGGRRVTIASLGDDRPLSAPVALVLHAGATLDVRER